MQHHTHKPHLQCICIYIYIYVFIHLYVNIDVYIYTHTANTQMPLSCNQAKDRQGPPALSANLGAD